MTTQYQIITTFIQMLEKSCFVLDGRQRLKFFLYQLKILLLRGEEKFSEANLSRLCPLEELEELRILLVEARTPAGALMVQSWLEEGLKRIIARLEGSSCPAGVMAGEEEAPTAGQTPQLGQGVNKDISNPGE